MKSQLERAFEEAAGPDREVCLTCLGPAVSNVEVPALFLHDDEPVPPCPDCGEAVHQSGKTAVTLDYQGRNMVPIFRLRPRRKRGDE